MSGIGQPDPPARGFPGTAMKETGISPEAPIERRLLTALFYDLVGSTALLARSDVEDFEELMAVFQKSASAAVTARGGSVVELGDGGIGLFPHELDARDAASLAIDAGLEILEACAQIGRERAQPDMHVRVGIASSIALIRGDRRKLTPDNVTALALAKATRLQDMADPDTVIVSDQTRALAGRSHVFRFEGVRQVKGIAEPERVWRALGHRLNVGRFYAFGRLNAPLFGRTAELQLISRHWAEAVAGSGSAILIQGEAGIGKSRLLHETRRLTRTERCRILLFQCSPGGSRSTLNPLIQGLAGLAGEMYGAVSKAVLSDVFAQVGIRDYEVVEIFSFLLGANSIQDHSLKDASPEVIRERAGHAVRRALDLVCAEGPVVIAVEDVHWIDPTSLHLVAELARSIHAHPALLILTSRERVPAELLELPQLTQIPLNRLDPNDTRLAIQALWPGGEPTDPELPEVIGRVTGGVPLFIE
jgi:class 3 adenylate cyclase